MKISKIIDILFTIVLVAVIFYIYAPVTLLKLGFFVLCITAIVSYACIFAWLLMMSVILIKDYSKP